MKKTLIVLVGALLTVGLWGCGESTPAENAENTITPAVQGAGDVANQAVTDAKKATEQK